MCVRSLWFAVCLLALLSPRVSEAGPWSRSPGKFYAKLNQGFLFSSDKRKEGDPANPYFAASTTFYGELGLIYGLQLHLSAPYMFATMSREDPAKQHIRYSLNSFGDGMVGLQWTPPFLQKRLGFPMALKINAKIPLYNTPTTNDPENEPGIPKDLDGSFPYQGDGQIDITIWYSVGGSIPNTPLYAFAELGYRIRTETFLDSRVGLYSLNFADTLTFSGQLGWSFYRNMIAMLNLTALYPLIDENATFKDVYSRGNVGVGVGLYIPVWKGLALEGNFNYLIPIVNTDSVVSFSVGLSYNKR